MSTKRDGPVALLAVCGLDVEARLVARLFPGIRTIAGGGDRFALAAAIERGIDDGAVGLLSIGLAGGLDPSLRAGALVVPSFVIDAEERMPVDERWTSALRRALPDAADGPMAGVDAIVGDVDAKRRLHASTGACAVDMESHVVARMARERSIPFVVLRAISDPADRALPPAALVSMRPDGGVDASAVARSVLARPGQIPRLVRLGLETRAALRGLDRGGRLLGARLGHPDLDQLLVDVV